MLAAARARAPEVPRRPSRGTEGADRWIEKAGFEALAITLEHGREAGRLPLIDTDPFDRLLVAQARTEGMTRATADEALARYGVPVLEVAPA